MKRIGQGMTGLFAIALGLAVVTLLAVGFPHDRHSYTAPAASVPGPAMVSGGGFTLASESVDLPDDDGRYPDGPGADVINANCTSCHSASMALTQAPMTRDGWAAIVHKMHDVYKAPVAEKDMPTIIDYLTRVAGKTSGPAKAPGEGAAGITG